MLMNEDCSRLTEDSKYKMKFAQDLICHTYIKNNKNYFLNIFKKSIYNFIHDPFPY